MQRKIENSLCDFFCALCIYSATSASRFCFYLKNSGTKKRSSGAPFFQWCDTAQSFKRRITTVPLVPPKPKELEMAISIFISLAVLGT